MLHQQKRSEESLSDEYGTPHPLVSELCITYNFIIRLDVCATPQNTQYKFFYTKKEDGLKQVWFDGSWCNPPHSETELWVRKAYEEWMKRNINIMMIIPSNSLCTNYALECIEGKAEYHPILRSKTRFIFNGEPAKFHSRNGYFVVIWRTRPD